MNFNQMEDTENDFISQQSSNPFDRVEQKYLLTKNSNSIKKNPFDVAEERIKKPYPIDEENALDRDIERNQARLTSRGIETIAGAPGDLLSFASSLFGKKQNLLPTSESLKEKSKELSQGYLSPKNEFEEFGDEIASDIASFAIPGSKHYSLIRNIGIPIVANLTKEGIKYSTHDEKKSAYGKMGTMLMLDIMSHRTGLGGGAKEFSTNLFKQADAALPKGQSIKASTLEKSLKSLEETLTMGGDRPSTKDALKKISEISSEIKNGKIDVKRLAAYRPSINEMIDQFGGFEIQLPKRIKENAIRQLNQVKGNVINTLDEYGKNLNPEFGKLHRAANESYAAYQNSNKIANFLNKHVAKYIKSPLGKTLLGLPAAGAGYHGLTHSSMGTLAATGAGASGAAVGYEVFKILNRMKNSPTLRTHYKNIVEGALRGNVNQVTKNSKLLDKELSENE